MATPLKIVGFAGSLRKNSYNKSLLKAVGSLLPPDAVLDIFPLESIPLYNQDLDTQIPQIVKDFKRKIREADALIIATPEYNYSIPGVLKNAIDWASRPYGDNAFDGKPVAIMGCTVGNLGTARSQYHLRQVCVFLNMYPINKPEVMVPAAHEKIDDQGTIVDAKTQEIVKDQMNALIAWTQKIKKS